jgi:serine/threonine protein kinase
MSNNFEKKLLLNNAELNESAATPENIDLALDLVGDVLHSPQELGRGKRGIVKTFNESSGESRGICVKEIFGYRETENDPKEEFMMQKNLAQDGFNVPRPILIVTEGKRSFIVMETIDGPSLKDITSGKASLPNNFNFEKFFQQLGKMLQQMHNIGRYHRDLHEGNVMIGPDGNPVLIDFGSTIESDEEDPYVSETITGKVLYTKDDDGLLNCRRSMIKYLTKK